MSDIDYHLRRARTERDIAYRSGEPCVADCHMRLSALHLQRALLLQEVLREPVGNVSPLRPRIGHVPEPASPRPRPLIELPSWR
ncbi:hypothetical protein [Sphingomonas sp.]|uniref:hypothetical protein n=1 Tax=Sphingomonas sp. TaxID=28214 RepID=UPI0017CF6B42|nr:hypothetical protein [Sphingomonas sp.]MBA3510435.1 hypothetical protein [Sphingomonas sp.]